MQTRTLLAAIATAAIAAIATPSLLSAQNPPPQTSKGEVATIPSFGSLISAINSTSARNDKIKGMTELTAENVQLVNVEDLLKGNNVEALNNALSKNEADIKLLRETLGANTTLNTAITTNATPAELKVDHVVAADVGADGKVILYYWKKP